MKHTFSRTGCMLMLALLTACGPSPEEIVAMTASAWTPTPVLPTPVPTTPTAPPTESPFLFFDGFDGGLGDGWTWIVEDATHWSLTDAPGFVRIIAQGTNIGADGGPKNSLVYPAPEGSFEIETYVRFEPTSNFQFAGLLVYEAQGKALQFGRAFARCNFPEFCKENALYFDNPTQQGAPNFVTPVLDPSVIYLRLARVGDTYTASYSGDALSWTQIGQHTVTIAPAYVGLIASQAYEEETPADFDYFSIRVLR